MRLDVIGMTASVIVATIYVAYLFSIGLHLR
jgi:hypothetical protein